MEYNFKNLVLPEGQTFPDDELKFLRTIDEGFTTVVGKNEGLQKQINDLYVENAKHGLKSFSSEKKYSQAEYNLNKKWIQHFFRGKDTSPVELEIKQAGFESYIDTSIDTGGGYVIPTLLQAEINRIVIEGGIARKEMRYLPFGGAGNTRNLPVDNTSASVEWVDEAGKKNLCTLTLDRVQQTLKKLACISILTEELLEDSAVDLVSYVATKIGEAIAAEEDNQFFSGTGAPWTGIINDLNVVTLSLAPGVGPIDMRPEALLALTVAIPASAARGGKYYMHSTVFAAICARRWDSVASGDSKGGYLIQQANQGTWPSIWGFPVVLVDAMPTLVDLGYGENDPTGEGTVDPDLPFIIFGNLQKCCVYGDKEGGNRVKILDQATLTDSEQNSVSLAQYDMVGVRVFRRVGYVIVLPAGISILCTGSAT